MIDSAALHASALVIDMHADTPQRFLDEAWDFTSSPLGPGMINLDTARRGNVAGEFFAIWVEPSEHTGNFAGRAFELLHATLDQVRRHPAQLQLCCSPADILDARAGGRFAVLLGVEGGHSIGNSLETLREFFALGVRYMTLTWNNNNEWADSSNDQELHGGLSTFGRDVIAEMNRLGMMVDVSHVSDKTFWQVLACSTAPVIASHSSARAITAARRNLSDEQLRALADKGGVASVNFFPAFLDARWGHEWELCRSARVAAHQQAAKPFHAAGKPVPYAVSGGIDRDFAGRLERPSFASLIAHFDHMLQVAGTEHVGIGTDFDGVPSLPAGIDSAADLPRITDALARKGYTARQLEGVLGGNLMRVFSAVLQQATSPPAA